MELTLKEKQEMVITEIDRLCKKAEEIYDLPNFKVTVMFSNKMTRCAGMAWTKKGLLKFSNTFMSHDDNFKDFLDRTVPHELAHVLADRYEYPLNTRKVHGPKFYVAMSKLGCKKEHLTRCHSYVNPTRLDWVCSSCNFEGTLTKKQASMIKNGTRRYHCLKCKTNISEQNIITKGVQVMATKKVQTKKVAPVKEVEEVKEVSGKVSPYGTAVDLMCKDPDMSKEKLIELCKKAGVNVESGKNAITTGYSAVRKVTSLLRKNKLM